MEENSVKLSSGFGSQMASMGLSTPSPLKEEGRGEGDEPRTTTWSVSMNAILLSLIFFCLTLTVPVGTLAADAGEPLTLAEAIAAALDHNPTW